MAPRSVSHSEEIDMTTRWVICWPSKPNPEVLHLRKRCMIIPVVLPQLALLPRPGPPEIGPLAEPWILGRDLGREAQGRLQVLATMHALAQHLESDARARFQRLAMESVGPLPDDMEINVHEFETK